LREWLTSLRGTRVDGMFCLDDPLPGVGDAVDTATHLMRRVLDIAKRRAGIGAATPPGHGGDPV
jgi:predicted ATP-grasp superfamily ATP-dependent carboligase